MLTVKILGSGRTNFISVESLAQKAITDLDVETEMVEEGDLKTSWLTQEQNQPGG
jgi:hypothetical protein